LTICKKLLIVSKVYYIWRLGMKPVKPILVLWLLLMAASHAVVINGGKGLPHTKAAWVSETGRLTMMRAIMTAR